MAKIDPDSNFRKYYLNDHLFYISVIQQEEPPYDFKIHLFLDNNTDEVSSKRYPQDYQDILDSIYGKLQDLGAGNITDMYLPDRPRRGDQEETKKKSSDKIRFLFTVGTEDEALKLYKYFHKRNEIQKYHNNKKLSAKDIEFKDADDLKV